MTKRAIVLTSGGLDSATCLAMLKRQSFECYSLSFDYGQRNRSELDAARRVAENLGAKLHRCVKLGIGVLGGSALTDQTIAVPDYRGDGKIPVTYVPARNTVFLSMALGWAEIVHAHHIVMGVNAVDYSGYPDCRPQYIEAFQSMANLATKAGVEGEQFKILTPLIKLNKAEIIKCGVELGIDYSTTVTCYQADEQGRACGRCDSCTLRRKGFLDAGVEDPTRYQIEDISIA